MSIVNESVNAVNAVNAFDDRLHDLTEACKNHPDFATIIHAVIQARENGPEPRHQKQHPHWSPYEYGKRQ